MQGGRVSITRWISTTSFRHKSGRYSLHVYLLDVNNQNFLHIIHKRMNNLKQFTGIFPVSKTLRFELNPVLLEGQTLNDFWQVYLDGPEGNDLHKLYKNDKERNCNSDVCYVSGLGVGKKCSLKYLRKSLAFRLLFCNFGRKSNLSLFKGSSDD